MNSEARTDQTLRKFKNSIAIEAFHIMDEFRIASQRNIIGSYISQVLWTECLKFYKSRTLKKKNGNRIGVLKDYMKGIEGSVSG